MTPTSAAVITPLAPGMVLRDGTYRIELNRSERQNDFNKQLGRVRAAGGVFDPVTHTYLVVADNPRSKVIVDWLIRRHHVAIERVT